MEKIGKEVGVILRTMCCTDIAQCYFCVWTADKAIKQGSLRQKPSVCIQGGCLSGVGGTTAAGRVDPFASSQGTPCLAGVADCRSHRVRVLQIKLHPGQLGQLLRLNKAKGCCNRCGLLGSVHVTRGSTHTEAGVEQLPAVQERHRREGRAVPERMSAAEVTNTAATAAAAAATEAAAAAAATEAAAAAAATEAAAAAAAAAAEAAAAAAARAGLAAERSTTPGTPHDAHTEATSGTSHKHLREACACV
jgi:hypothetical protein